MGGSASVVEPPSISMRSMSSFRMSSFTNLEKGGSSVNVQDEARSFRSKVGAIKLLIRNETYREHFVNLLKTREKGEFVEKYFLLETLRKQIYELSKTHKENLNHLNEVCDIQVPLDFAPSTITASTNKTVLQHVLSPLYNLSEHKTTYKQWFRAISRAQEGLLTQLFEEFEIFKKSEHFSSTKLSHGHEQVSCIAGNDSMSQITTLQHSNSNDIPHELLAVSSQATIPVLSTAPSTLQ